MKKIITIFTSCLLISCASVPENVPEDKHIKTEIEVVQNGAITFTITYRDDKKIMSEMKGITKAGPIHTRALFLNDKIMYVESDEDHDVFFESIMISEDDSWPAPFEMFIRDKENGSIRPIPSAQYEEKQKKLGIASIKLRKALRKAALEEKAKLEKEGKPITGWLKEQLERLKEE